MRTLTIGVVIALASPGSVLAQERLPLVKVVATGGTIANTPSGRLHAGEVAEAIPELKKVARLEVEELMRVGSSAITLANWLTLAKRTARRTSCRSSGSRRATRRAARGP